MSMIMGIYGESLMTWLTTIDIVPFGVKGSAY